MRTRERRRWARSAFFLSPGRGPADTAQGGSGIPPPGGTLGISKWGSKKGRLGEVVDDPEDAGDVPHDPEGRHRELPPSAPFHPHRLSPPRGEGGGLKVPSSPVLLFIPNPKTAPPLARRPTHHREKWGKRWWGISSRLPRTPPSTHVPTSKGGGGGLRWGGV